MLLVIDCGNTRTKWALVDSAGKLQTTEVCLNTELSKSTLAQAAKKASKVFIANVAGESVAQTIAKLLAPQNAHFIVAKQQACGVLNHYKQAEKLGADRWAALIAAWHANKQATLVINAGTAITIDCLAASEDGKGLFLGGTIMPGLRLMQSALSQNTAQLNVGEGKAITFPLSTENAIQTGCLNAAIGAIAVMLQTLEKECGTAPKLLMSGGDAATISDALLAHLKLDEKRVMIVENLVLQGLAILQKEYI